MANMAITAAATMPPTAPRPRVRTRSSELVLVRVAVIGGSLVAGERFVLDDSETRRARRRLPSDLR